MSSPDLIRDELTRSARELGAPETVAPVLERPRDPAFGEWTTNLAMTLAKPLRRKPQDIATALIGAMDLQRAGVRRRWSSRAAVRREASGSRAG